MSDGAVVSSVPVTRHKQRIARFAVWLQKSLPALYQWLASRENKHWRREVPFTPLTKPIDQCKVALVTTGGLILREHEPFDLNDSAGDCSYRVIPDNAAPEDIVISHLFYDRSSVEVDTEVMLPLALLRRYASEGKIGAVAPRHFSFSGGIPDPTPLVTEYAPEVARHLAEDEVDLVVLTPA
ncbi:MAG: glycine/sarcosine/betaine reductase selenoprotein B family protein [Candidatus Binatia bacterium]